MPLTSFMPVRFAFHCMPFSLLDVAIIHR